jgi:glycosyltransferase involved in cell wall biosynthesis
MADQFAIAVVVATRNRAGRLARLVTALEQQLGIASLEVVVVDDASTDDTWSTLMNLSDSSSLSLVPRRLEENAGPAHARNIGWKMARAPLVAFTDDDCVPQPGWLAALVRGLEDADLVQGCTLPNPDQRPLLGPFSRTIETTREWGFYETCNMGYRRAVLERVDGFDERFRYPFGEDTDLAWRAKEQGARSAFVADALVYHDISPSDFVAKLKDLRRREGLVLAVRAHPELRFRFPRRFFWQRSHPPAVLAALGLALAPVTAATGWRWLLVLYLVRPYVRYRMRVAPVGDPKSWPLVIPLTLVSDVAEIGVLAAASLRYRTLVL